MIFGRINLKLTSYTVKLNAKLLDPVPIEEIKRVYKEYCVYKKFTSVVPIIPGRFLMPGTEVLGYFEQDKLIAWSMYRIWDEKNIVSDYHAWDYKNPNLRIGQISLENECALYREQGYHFMYFESVETYMQNLQGFEILGGL